MLRDAQGVYDIWLHEVARNATTRFTFHPAHDFAPVWSPDGSSIAFTSPRDGQMHLYRKVSSGGSEEEPLLKIHDVMFATDWSPDGRSILYHTSGTNTGFDLWLLPLEGERKPVPFLQTEFHEVLGQFSPDGKWVAYASNDSGRFEVYVRSFPKSTGKWQISTAGGNQPRWRRDGHELFYMTADRKLMAVDVKTSGDKLEASRPRELFQTSSAPLPFWGIAYDVTADGKRFLINSALQDTTASPMIVVLNWTAGLKK